MNGGDGSDTLVGDDGNDSLYGGDGNDSLDGGSDKDTLNGGSGNDSLNGGDGNDSLSGGDGKDELYGGDGNDYLHGGNGNDSLWGNAGNDTIWGGNGSDVFIYEPNEGTDYIMDFTSSDALQILTEDGSQGTFSDSSFKSSTLTLAIDGGGSVVFKNVSAKTTFHINDDTYTISGTELVVKE